MAIYTVHKPPMKRTEPDPERFKFVRDGFYFWAFLLGPVWMMRPAVAGAGGYVA